MPERTGSGWRVVVAPQDEPRDRGMSAERFGDGDDRRLGGMCAQRVVEDAFAEQIGRDGDASGRFGKRGQRIGQGVIQRQDAHRSPQRTREVRRRPGEVGTGNRMP